MIYDPKGCIFDMSKYGLSHKKVYAMLEDQDIWYLKKHKFLFRRMSYKHLASILINVMVIQSVIILKLNDSMLE